MRNKWQVTINGKPIDYSITVQKGTELDTSFRLAPVIRSQVFGIAATVPSHVAAEAAYIDRMLQECSTAANVSIHEVKQALAKTPLSLVDLHRGLLCGDVIIKDGQVEVSIAKLARLLSS